MFGLSAQLRPILKLFLLQVAVFIVSRFLQGAGASMFSISFVLLLEITGPRHRALAGNVTAYGFSVGRLIVCALAHRARDWRKIQWCMAFYVLPFLTAYWLVPESPRWLLSFGRVDEARRVLVKITRVSTHFGVATPNPRSVIG